MNEQDHEDAGDEERPERVHVQRRERHVPRADQQRDAEVAERADEDRRDREEDHDQARAS